MYSFMHKKLNSNEALNQESIKNDKYPQRLLVCLKVQLFHLRIPLKNTSILNVKSFTKSLYIFMYSLSLYERSTIK